MTSDRTDIMPVSFVGRASRCAEALDGKAGCVCLVQLPFPSTSDPHPDLVAYYRDYGRKFARLIPEYVVPTGGLWEMPLWIAHLAGMVHAVGGDPRLLDLSRDAAVAAVCLSKILAATELGSTVFLSPLAQNLDLATEVSRELVAHGRRTVIGGNMTALVNPADATIVFHGLVDPHAVKRLLMPDVSGSVVDESRQVRSPALPVDWVPRYDLLKEYDHRVPLLRLNASHGCRYNCAFCGDRWSGRLDVVNRSVLEREVAQFEQLFPETRLIYIGDKTFGQSREAIDNLLTVFASRPQYRLIVQTHILKVDDALLEVFRRLNVAAVELGFESADTSALRSSRKASLPPDDYCRVLDRIRSTGIEVILNVLGALPHEEATSHQATIRAIERWKGRVFLYNLYNFVPYPLTPFFSVIRDRIFNWSFKDWREDAPPVFEPYHVTADESWSYFLHKVTTAHDAISA